MYHVNYTVGYW